MIITAMIITAMIITDMVITDMIATCTEMRVTVNGIGGGLVGAITSGVLPGSGVVITDGLVPLRPTLRLALVVQPRTGKSGNLTRSSVLVGVVVPDVGAPLLPALRFRGRLALGIMMRTLIKIGGGRFDVVHPINQLTLGVLPGTGLGITEDFVQLGPHSGFALKKV
jgi:hypothetical protein